MNPSPLIGLVLAGGHSRRMGRDKAALEFDGRSVLARTVGLLTPVCEQVLVGIRDDQVTDPLRQQHSQLLDPPGETGPMGSIFQALETFPRHGILVLACDMPWLDQDCLQELILARDSRCEATAMVASDGLVHPLCAIWEPGCRAQLALAIAQDHLSPRKFLEQAEIRRVVPANPAALRNINQPQDLNP